MPRLLSVSLLGGFGITYGGAAVTDVDTPRLQSLLAYLLLHSDAPQSRAHLAFLFWPDTTEAQARTNLRNLLHHLRRALPDCQALLDASTQTLQLRPGTSLAFDVADFRAALADAERARRAGDPTAARLALEQAIDLYRGDLLPSCYDDWIQPEREELHQAALGALEQLGRIQEDQRDYTAAIRTAQHLLRRDLVQEATYRRLIRLHALAGDRAGALRAYHTCATVLQRELEVEPSAATREAYEQLLGAEPVPLPAVSGTTAFSPLVGREQEWAQMLRAWRLVAAGGEPHAVVLRGEAGIGKTRLAEELLQWAARQGIASAYARCYAAEGELALAPVTAWLRAHALAPLGDVWLAEVARLVPEVLAGRSDLPRPAALTEAWQRERLFEALSRAVLGAGQPLLLVMDDLQWCDRDTLEWLHFLLRFERSARLLIVGTYRPEEVGERHPLVASLQALRLQGQLSEVDLGPLDEVGTEALATRIAGVEIGSRTAHLLFHETEGNPLFVVETVRAGLPGQLLEDQAAAPKRLPQGLAPGSLGLPPKVRSVLEARLGQLSPPARELAELAATIGREFHFRLLALASGREDELLVRELDELWQRRIVRERGADAYDFGHDKLREVAYGGMSGARRRLLHRRVAQALEALHAEELDPVSHQVASHYERAGLPDRAVPYYLRAAQAARRVFANEEAAALLRRGLSLAETDGGQKDDVAARLWEETGDLLALKAEHEEALHAFREAEARLSGADGTARARLYRKVGAVRREQRLYPEALDSFRRAEAILGERPAGEAGPWWDEWLEVQMERVWVHYWLAQWPEMGEVVLRVQPVMQARGSGTDRMNFLWVSCMLHLRKDRYVVSDQMLADAREGFGLCAQWGSQKQRIEWQFEVGFLHLWRGELEEAEEHLQAALRQAEISEGRLMQTLSLTYLTVLRRFRGQVEEVQRTVRCALEAAEAAHMPDYVAAAGGNQAWLAYRRGDPARAETLGREALALWERSPLVYPFQWQALWPLLCVALGQGQEAEAGALAKALLEPKQQRLPDRLASALEAGLQARAEEQLDAARAHLEQAVQLARELGYL